MDKRLVFTITTGRSGTGLLADLLNYVQGLEVAHEPQPFFQDVMRQGLSEKGLLRKFWIEQKLPAILQSNSSIYIETSHLFCKGFVEPLLELGIVPDLIILHRAERDVAKSLYQLNTIPGRTDKALFYYLKPSDTGVFLKYPNWEQAHDYQLCFWYTLEIRLRQKIYAELISNLGGKICHVDFRELTSGEALYKLHKELKLPSISKKYWLKSLLKKIPKVNAKNAMKSKLVLSNEERFDLEDEVYRKTNFLHII